MLLSLLPCKLEELVLEVLSVRTEMGQQSLTEVRGPNTVESDPVHDLSEEVSLSAVLPRHPQDCIEFSVEPGHQPVCLSLVISVPLRGTANCKMLIISQIQVLSPTLTIP